MRLPKIHNHSRAINIANCSFGWNPQTEQLEIYEQSREITLIQRGDVGIYRIFLKHKPSFWKRVVMGNYISYENCHYRAHVQIVGSEAFFNTSSQIKGSEKVDDPTYHQWLLQVWVRTFNPDAEPPAWEFKDAPLAVDIWDNESPAARYYTGGNGG